MRALRRFPPRLLPSGTGAGTGPGGLPRAFRLALRARPSLRAAFPAAPEPRSPAEALARRVRALTTEAAMGREGEGRRAGRRREGRMCARWGPPLPAARLAPPRREPRAAPAGSGAGKSVLNRFEVASKSVSVAGVCCLRTSGARARKAEPEPPGSAARTARAGRRPVAPALRGAAGGGGKGSAEEGRRAAFLPPSQTAGVPSVRRAGSS